MIGRLAILRALAAAMIVVIAVLGGPGVRAQQQNADQRPQKVEDLLKLLSDPDVQKWLSTQKQISPLPVQSATDQASDLTFAGFINRIHQHFADLAAAIPDLPAQIAAAAGEIANELEGRGPGWMVLLLAVFVGAGFAVQWLFWHLSRGWREWIAAARFATIRDRLVTIAARFVWSACHVLAFALGSIGAFLVFDWPPIVREIVVGYLLAAVMFRLARVTLEFLLSPPVSSTFGDAERFRIIPMTGEAATFWTRRFTIAAGWFAFGWVTIGLLGTLGFPRPSQQLIAYALGLILLAIGIEAVWRRPDAGPAAVAGNRQRWASGRTKAWLWSVCFTALWLMWVAGAMRLFWLTAVAVGLPIVVQLTEKAVNNILRPPGMLPEGEDVPSTFAAVVERGIRALLIVAAVLFLAHRWGIDLTQITARDTFEMRIVRGIFSAIVITLIADIIWHASKTVIDRRMVEASNPGEPGSEDARRRARLRTLLPIVRNVLMIAVAIVAMLMVLSSLGIQVAPLIAGAGVVGVAIGFGAQTIVKDIISGVFYLLDDAFRVGEYIQSGSYKGTVESFSLRSVKLRHQRGAIYIVPFSELGAVQNMSRDWAIEKMTVTVTYDSDVEKARKIVKKIGLELAEDPEFKASTIEPLKMQGIDDFGDSGMVLRMKLKTRPGEQFGIKRRALMMIKAAFDENGIKMAFPTVQIAGGSEAEIAAAARQALAMKATAETAA